MPPTRSRVSTKFTRRGLQGALLEETDVQVSLEVPPLDSAREGNSVLSRSLQGKKEEEGRGRRKERTGIKLPEDTPMGHWGVPQAKRGSLSRDWP